MSLYMKTILVLVMAIDCHSAWFPHFVMQFHLVVYLSSTALSNHRLFSIHLLFLASAFLLKRNDLMTMMTMIFDACHQNATSLRLMNEIDANHCHCYCYSIYAFLFVFCRFCFWIWVIAMTMVTTKMNALIS